MHTPFMHTPAPPSAFAGQPPLLGPQFTVPPQPSDAVPQTAAPQAVAVEDGVHVHMLLVHISFGLVVGHVPQLTVATAQPAGLVIVPQLSPAGQAVGQERQAPATQVRPVAQLPQLTVPPQPSEAVPQTAAPQEVAAEDGTQVHTLFVHTSGLVQEAPQVIVELAQPAGLVMVPQLSPAGQVVGQERQAPATQVRPVAQLPQFTVLPQPSGAVPQTAVPQAVAVEDGVHVHMLLVHISFGLVVGQVPQLTVVTAQPAGLVIVPQLSPAGQVVGQERQAPATQVRPVAQLPQLTVPPQPLDAVPQTAAPQAVAVEDGTQVHTLFMHTSGLVHEAPQLIVELGQPAGLVMVPQLSPVGQVVGQERQAPATQVRPVAQLPQFTVLPQPSGAVPQTAVRQAVAVDDAVHEHTLFVHVSFALVAGQVPQLTVAIAQPAGLVMVPQSSPAGQVEAQPTQAPATQVCPLAQLHVTVPPQPLDAVPQLPAVQAFALEVGVQVHTLFVHVSFGLVVGQVPQFIVVTEQPAGFVMVPQLSPVGQAEAHARQVPPMQLSPLVQACPHAPQLLTSSVVFTHAPLHKTFGAVQPVTTHSPPWQASVPPAIAQVCPHVPQLFASVDRSVSQPTPDATQCAYPALHPDVTQFDAVHVQVALSPLHAFPQVPQLVVVLSAASQPSLGLSLQSA